MNTLINHLSSLTTLILNSYSKQFSQIKLKTLKAAFFMLPCFLIVPATHASLLLDVDLSVENTISISATSGSSLISASGSDFTGVYLEDFFGANAVGSIFTSAISGNLTSANDASDLSPSLFQATNDPGLNIFSFANAEIVSFTQGALAFVGSATWNLSEQAYKLALNGAQSGNIFFPADTVDDLDNAFILGSWAVRGVDAQVPEPAMLALFILGLAGAGTSRIRRA